MNIVREHEGRYSIIGADGKLAGQLMKNPHGWVARDAKGYGPRQASVSPARAMELAVIVGHFQEQDWRMMIREADEKFSHNQRVVMENPR